MIQVLARFLIGGLVVSSFAIVGDLFKPKSFADLFGAAPSVALATLGLTVASEGGIERGREAASVDAAGAAIGSVGLFVFALTVRQFITNHAAWTVLTGATIAWLASSVLLWLIRKRA